MKLKSALLALAVGALSMGAIACDGTPVQQRLQPLLPDTGNLGLSAVSGLPVLSLIADAALDDPTLLRVLNERRANPQVAAARFARIIEGVDSVLTVGRLLAFDVSPTRRLVFLGKRRAQSASGYTEWIGELQGGLTGQMVLVSKNDVTTASLTITGSTPTLYSLEPWGNRFQLIQYLDYRNLPID